MLLVGTTAVAVWQWRRAEDEPALEAAPTPAPTTTEQAPPEEERGPLDDLLGDEGLGGLLGGGACLEGVDVGSAEVSDAGAAEQLADIRALVEEERELRFESPVEPEYLDDDAIAARLEELAGEEYGVQEADLDARTLALLGAVEPGTDLRATRSELLGESVAGFYDPATGELVVRADDPDEALGGVEQVTLAHELQHALADQALELPVDADAPEGADAALAALAVVEGDATLTMQRFSLAALDLGDQLGMLADPSVLEGSAALEDVPHVLAQSLQFPYVEGLAYVCERFADGGWDAVDAAYEDLPPSTAAVLFPERGGEAPLEPAGVGDPAGPWRSARADTIGAAELLWLLEAPGDDRDEALDDARDRVGAWGGGIAELFTDGDRSALGLSFVEHPDGDDLCGTVTEWYSAAFGSDGPGRGDEALVHDGDDQDAVVSCSGDSVRVGIAPDLATARALVAP